MGTAVSGLKCVTTRSTNFRTPSPEKVNRRWNLRTRKARRAHKASPRAKDSGNPSRTTSNSTGIGSPIDPACARSACHPALVSLAELHHNVDIGFSMCEVSQFLIAEATTPFASLEQGGRQGGSAPAPCRSCRPQLLSVEQAASVPGHKEDAVRTPSPDRYERSFALTEMPGALTI
jgi:hypothetical protein